MLEESDEGRGRGLKGQRPTQEGGREEGDGGGGRVVGTPTDRPDPTPSTVSESL